MSPKDLALSEDELYISKQDVKDMISGLIKRSRRNEEQAKERGENPMKFGKLYRTTLIGFKGVIDFTPEKAVSMVWGDILKFFNLLIIRNKMAQEDEMIKSGQIKKSPLKITFDKLISDIKEGNW